MRVRRLDIYATIIFLLLVAFLMLLMEPDSGPYRLTTHNRWEDIQPKHNNHWGD